MRKLLAAATVLTLLFLASCAPDNGFNNGYNNYNSTYNNNSNLSFWMSAICSSNLVTVTVNGQSSQITQYFPNNAPTCPSNGCANFYLPAGTYTYTAKSSDTTWQGSVTVNKVGCTMQQLQCMTGNVTFWVDSAANNVKVTLAGANSHINVSFPTSTPGCGTTGCANFTLYPGIYTYTAITAANVGYTGSVTVLNDSCTLVKLY